LGRGARGVTCLQMPLASQIELPDRYRVARHIASGGMASVWEAEDLMLRRTVAVKVLASQLALDSGARERFQREARTAAQISDRPHIVTIYDIGEHREHAFIVMEYCSGGTVADRLRAARAAGEGAGISRETALRWLREAAIGLDSAHAADIVHRDVKPANLMLDAHDRLAVGDFGIARLADDTQMTMTGQVLGTAAYLSPEQALGKPATDASDRYALAVVAYELLTGARPFTGGPPAVQARQHVEAPPPKASDAAPDLPPGIDAVLARGLAKEPAQRPVSATAFVDELERALEPQAPSAVEPTRRIAPVLPTQPTHRQEPSRPLPPVPVPVPVAAPTRPPPPPRQPPRAPAPESDPEPRQRSRRLTPLALLAAGALAIGGIAALAAGGEEKPSSNDKASGTATLGRDGTKSTAKTTSTPTPATEQPATPSGENPSAIDARAYDLIKQGKFAEAVPIAQQAVEGFRARKQTSSQGYGFALFNLGTALHGAGRSSEAIPYLEERLRVSPDDRPEQVQKVLAAAQAAVGGGAAPDKKPKRNGKGADE